MAKLAGIKGTILVVGDVMTDIIVRPEGPIVPGSDRRAKIQMISGGSSANQAVWMAHFQLPVALFARIGVDDATSLTAAFQRDGVTPHLALDGTTQSGCLVTLVDPDGERSFLTDRGANLNLCYEDLPTEWWRETGLLQLSGYSFVAPGPRAVVQRMMIAARAQNIPVSIDPGSAGFMREIGAAAFRDWVGAADFLFANEDEATVLSGVFEGKDQIARLSDQFELVVIKRGKNGAIAGDRNGILAEIDAECVSAMDTTGAGDAFLAGFIAAMDDGAEIHACLRAGNAAGARAVQIIGGRPVSGG